MWKFYDLWLELLGEVGMGHWSHVDCNIYDMFCVLLVLHVVCLCLGIAIVVVILYMLQYFLQGTIKRKGTTTLPPGSSGLPFLGETLELFYASKANKVLEDFLNPRVAKYGQVFKTNLLFSPAVSLDAPEGNKFLFSNEDKLVQNSWPSSMKKLLGCGSLTTQTGKKHKLARYALTSFLGPEGLKNFMPRMHKITKAHLAEFWEGKDEIMAGTELKRFTLSLAIDLFVSKTEGPEFHSLTHDIRTFLTGMVQLPLDFPGTMYHKARLARESILHTFDKIMSCRHNKALEEEEEGKISTHHDLLSALMSAHDDDRGHPITNEEIKDNILLVLSAGLDSTSSALAVVLKYLCLNPHCLQEVIKEQREIEVAKVGALLSWDDTRKMKYTWQVIQETMRIQPIAQMGNRLAIKEFEYGGFTIPKGWKLFWHVGRSHMSPTFFPNPKSFNPSRFEGQGPQPFTYVPFGGGPHMCPGIEFARTQMVVFLHYLVLNYEWSMVDPNEKISMDPFPIFQNGLHLKIHQKKQPKIH